MKNPSTSFSLLAFSICSVIKAISSAEMHFSDILRKQALYPGKSKWKALTKTKSVDFELLI